MKAILRCLLLCFFFLSSTQLFAQTLIAGWDFQTTTNSGTAAAASPNAPTTYVANVGSGTIYLNGTNGSSSWVTASTGNEVTAFSGSTLNVGAGMAATGLSLALVGGTGGTASNGKYMSFVVNMAGYKNLVISYATQGTTAGYTSQAWEWSTDGVNFTSAGVAIVPPTSFAIRTVTTITGLDNVGTAYIRMKGSGATGATGNNRFDNIQFNATPMAATQASAVTFASTTTTTTTASWTNGNGASRAVFITAATTGSPAPVDGTTYTADPAFGSGTQIGTSGWYCIYNGTGTSVNITNLSSGTPYRVAVVEYTTPATPTPPIYSTATATGNPANVTTTSGGAQSTDATLSNLAISSGTLNPVFASGTASYTASVNYSASSVTVTPTVNQANASVQVKVNSGSYSAVSSGSASAALPLNVGSNTITVLSTAQDGTSTASYTITVTRGIASTDATLSGLTTAAGTLTPTFSSTTANYSVSVTNGTASTTVTPVANEANATIQTRVNGGTYTNVASNTQSGSLTLSIGTNTIDVLVTAQDGSTTQTYTITVTRPIATPTLAAAAGISDTNFSADWAPVSGAASYAYDVATDSGFGALIITNASTTLTNAIVTGLTANTTYYFRVRAVGASTTSANSSTVTVATLAASNFTANYDFNSVTTTSGTTDPTPVPVVPGVSFNAVTANGVSTNSSSANIFNFTNWGTSTTTPDGAKYYEVTIAPASGYNVTLNSLTFSVQRSGTGAANYSVRSSADGYAADLPASVNPTNANLTVSGNIFTNSNSSALQVGSTITPGLTTTGPVTFRIYGYGSTNSGGTFRLDDVKFSGTVAVSPVFYSKATGDLSSLSTYGTSTDGTGTAPTDFNGSGTNAIYQLANRGTYTLTSSLTLGSPLNIPSASTLDIGGNTLTLTTLNGTGTLSGSNTSSLVVNGTISGLSFAAGREQLNNLSLGSGASVTLTSALSIAGTGAVALATNATLRTSGLLTLKSNASGTGLISALGSGAAILGNVTVERFIYDKRAWRLITSPVNSTQTINAAWQEGAGGTTSDPSPGYGTLIIGNSTANGFDVAGTAGSLLVYDGTAFGNAANTNAISLSSTPGYFLFSIGSRNINPSTAGAHSSTTLRSTGSIKTGTQTATITAAGYTLVGNPYAAPVDFAQVTRSASVSNQFYVWDINLGTYGGYVLVTNSGGGYTSVPSSPSGLNNIIPSGAAIFVQSDGTNAGTLTFNESSKAIAAGSGAFSNFSNSVAAKQHNFRVNLTDGSSNLIDGVMASFAAGYSNKVDGADASKLPNFYENISLSRLGKELTMERRSDLATRDTIFIQLSGMKAASYQLQVNPADFNEPGMTAYLEDAYLHTHTKLDLTQVSNTAFSASSDTTTYKKRFQITFIPETPSVATKISHIGAGVIAYPNPAVQKQINLSFDGMPAGNYNITVMNTFGQIMQKNSMTYNGTTANKLLTADYSTGVYTVNIQSAGYNQSIKVIIP